MAYTMVHRLMQRRYPDLFMHSAKAGRTLASKPRVPGVSRRALRLSLLLQPVLLLGACAALPVGVEPPAGGLGALPVSQTLSAAAIAPSPAAPGTSAWPGEDWWQAYGDAQLPRLIREALDHSPDVAAANARLAKARAMAGVAESGLYPRLDGNATVGGTKQSYNIGFPPQFVPHGWKREGALTATLGWDPDLWGRNRAGVAAALSARQAAAIEASAARLALATAVADAYAGLAGDMATRDVRQATLANRAAIEKLVTLRFDQGLDARTTLDIARAGAAAARAEVSAAEARVALRRNQLAALLGQGPDRGLTIAAPALDPLADRAIPDDASSDLLGRRPDIAAARARAQAAAARVRAARADFFPAIRLQGLAGYQSLGLDQLLTPGSTMGTVGPAMTLPIFHGGELRGQYRGARADYDLAVADYNRTVVAAYQQLADAVTMRAQLMRQRDDAAIAEAASQEAYNLTTARFNGGLAKGLDVLASQERLLNARAALSAADTAAHQADIALIRALGGGYTSHHALAASSSQGSTP